MKATAAAIEEILEVLERTPQILSRLAASSSAGQLAFAPDAKSWSAQQVLGHLRACADLWTHSIYAMLAEKEPELPDINERKYARAAGYPEVSFQHALAAFSLQRENLLRVIRLLKPEEWERGALISGRRHTVFTQVRRLAKHEADHCDQIEGLLK